MKRFLILFFLFLSIFWISLFLIKEAREAKHEVREEPCLVPTSTPKPRLSYLYGRASWYGQEYCGSRRCRTANGDVFDENAFTAACSDDFPLGSRLVVSYFEKSIEVVCTDKGGFTAKHGRILDLTKKVFEAFAPIEKGTIWVRVKKVD